MMLEGLHPNNPTHVARIVTDEASARRIADLLGESFDPVETAIAAFEREDGTARPDWLVEVYFATPPDETAVTELIRLAAGGLVDVTFDAFGEKDWVAASLEGLSPVPAGRFIVHGSPRPGPDRAKHHRHRDRGGARLRHRPPRHDARLPPRSRRAPQAPPPAPAPRHRHRDGRPRHRRRPRLAPWRASHPTSTREAVATARNNVRHNRAGAFVRPVVARGTTSPRIRAGRPYDLVFANILAGPLVRLAAPMARLLAPGATVILSGLLHAHANAALAAYRMQGLSLVTRYRLDEWTTLVLRRGGASARKLSLTPDRSDRP